MKKREKCISIVIGVICIVAIPIIYNMIYDKSQQTNAPLENKVENEVVDKIKGNEIENIIIGGTNAVTEQNIISGENTVKEPSKTETTIIDENTTGSAVYEQTSDLGSTDKKQEAIDLVKQKWGQDNTVNFRCDSVENNGEYIIAVISKDSAKVKNYFRVNLENKTVIVDY